MEHATGGPPLEISPQDAHAHDFSSSGALLLDCRTPGEWSHCRIEGAKLLPMQELAARLSELEAHRGAPIIVYCHHGRRSLAVVHALRRAGFARAQSMAGGIDRWSREIDPAVPLY
ncbi:MAG: hypothetical protein KDA25_06020 [Phycisphaerales bacterium]|nr:hypothetical protein [Phycisphaerales bacterium]